MYQSRAGSREYAAISPNPLTNPSSHSLKECGIRGAEVDISTRTSSKKKAVHSEAVLSFLYLPGVSSEWLRFKDKMAAHSLESNGLGLIVKQ